MIPNYHFKKTFDIGQANWSPHILSFQQHQSAIVSLIWLVHSPFYWLFFPPSILPNCSQTKTHCPFSSCDGRHLDLSRGIIVAWTASRESFFASQEKHLSGRNLGWCGQMGAFTISAFCRRFFLQGWRRPKWYRVRQNGALMMNWQGPACISFISFYFKHFNILHTYLHE